MSRNDTTAQGNLFRESIRQLIALTPGCTNVQVEYPIGSQAVDIYYEERTSFNLMRVACECKDYGAPLTRELLASKIWPRYSPLLQSNLIDAVRVIAPLPINVNAQAYIRDIGFTFQTADEVASQVIDFRPYMLGLKSSFAEDGLDRYYIRPVLAEANDLESTLVDWIAAESSRPIAILAGYGMGKTSFARRVAFLLANNALARAQERIPIIIPLSEISGEQDLEGLLGKIFSARHPLQGYSFPAFMELNRRGRFVVILDGFDEMKHSISWGEFERNFTELNRLTGACTRVLLLGRPSALMSDDEYLFVLRGKRRSGSLMLHVEGAPDYLELALRPFTSEQALAFMEMYAGYRSAADAASRADTSTFTEINTRLESIRQDAEMMSLILRPVQAKMLADLAIDPGVNWRSFTRYELYSEFVRRITDREARKPTRSAVDGSTRLKFLRKLAWWVWTRSSSSGFRAPDVPNNLVGDITGGDPDADLLSKKRELIAGSLLESKASDTYYFPHRSFLEFLVAEYCCLEGPTGPSLEDLPSAITPDVRSFIQESGHASTVASWINRLNNIEASLSSEFFALIAWAANATQYPATFESNPESTPREALFRLFRQKDGNAPPNEIANQLASTYRVAYDPQTRLTCLASLLAVQQFADTPLKVALCQ
jgi:hypothetical protein